jgi:hypothetical protein
MSQKIALIVGAMLDDAAAAASSLPSFLSAMELVTLTSITNAYCAPHG